MQPLDKTLRNRLERTIKDARDIAEDAAQAALEQLGVGQAAPDSHLSAAERELRRRLRVHGRQLGDQRHAAKQTQQLDRLIEEVAYEHWHRMLFARFLAENNLLMYPDPDDPVAVTLEECEDLAADEGAANGWELAARYAARMLPQIFRLDSPVFELTLPPEHEQKLERLVADLPLEVFTASDSLGWVYQFWQAKKKDEVNASEVKIGARELPAVTQLFTEPYMVSFLLDNSLGAWWAARKLTESDFKNAKSEDELRQKAAIPGVPLEYLRFIKVSSPHEGEGQGEGGIWMPAAGTFDAWPEQLAELKTLDPCCGSGHFLVAAFLMLVPMRMERDGLSAQEAVDAVLRENIHGLELDQRCVELAAFALALTAWKYPDSNGYRVLPELNIACSGLSVSVAKEEWKQLGLGKKNLTIALDWLHDTFRDAPELGSLLDPAKTDAAKLVQWDELLVTLEQALKHEKSEVQHEIAVVAQGLAKATTLLAGQYHLVITNVPYLALGKQSTRIQEFCAKNYSFSKHDLATVFLERCLEFCVIGGTTSIVLPQNWLFLSSYRKFREKLLTNETFNYIARLGAGAFETISGEVVKAILITLSRDCKIAQGIDLNSLTDDIQIHGIDVSKQSGAEMKSRSLQIEKQTCVSQKQQLENPDARILSDTVVSTNLNNLSNSVTLHEGMSRGDTGRYDRFYWEINKKSSSYSYFINSPGDTKEFSGRELLIYWENGKGSLANSDGARLTGYKAWGKRGVFVARTGDLKSTLSEGVMHAQNGAVLLPNHEDELLPLWCYCKNKQFSETVRAFDQKIIVASGALLAVPFDLEYWSNIAKNEYPNGLVRPYTNDATQWIFHGYPCGTVAWDEEKKWTAQGPPRIDDTVLQVTVARLLGYRWPTELDPEMELADEQREWVNRCEALLTYADDDGIVCIPPVRGEAAADDRLLNLLAAAYDDAWSNDTLAQLLKSVGHTGKTLETWLREKFFTQHCKLFQHRPFIWHIWDGLRDGFAALVNYHKFDHKLLETLIYTYLGDWISRQKQDIANGVDGAQEKLSAAEALKKKLELILEGEGYPDQGYGYDIFVRWKPIDKQPIGWNPDLNDGVRLNIRPFLTVPDVGKKGAGVLRDKPNIKWTKDRGKDVESAPWFKVFNGDRINDHHLRLSEKRAARKEAGE